MTTSYLLDTDMQHIKNISVISPIIFFSDNFTYDLYFLVCYKFRDSISHLIIDYIGSNFQQIDILNSLADFRQLTQLEFRNSHSTNLTPSHVLDRCPKLKYLKYVSDFQVSESVMLHLLGKNNVISLNFAASLRYLNLRLPSLSAMYTRYLVDYFPNQLNDSSISISRQNIFSWIDIVGMELALKLMEKIGRIKETYISFDLNDRYEVQTNDETKMTKYFRLLNVFRGNRQTHCTAYFSELIDVEKTNFSFSYVTNGRLFATYGLHDDDFLGPNGDLDLPDKISSTIGPEIFNILKFNISSIYGDVIYRTLSYSLLSCPKLEKFHFTYEYPYRCLVSFLGYKHREDPTSSTLTKGNFNFLEMAFISSAQCYFDLVTAYLHGIEALSLKMYDWNRANNDSVLDLRGFKKLKNFTYKSVTEYSENNDSDQENDFVLIRSTNGKERYYYLDEEKNKNPQVEYNKNPTTPCLTVFCDASVSFDFCKGITF